MATLSSAWAAVGFGLVIASVLAISALGFNLTVAVSNVLNIGFVSFIIVGQFLAYALGGLPGRPWFSILLACALTGVMGLAVGLLVERVFNRRGAPPFVVVLVTFALTSITVSVLTMIFGSVAFGFAVPPSLTSPINVIGLQFTGVQLIVLAIAVAALSVADVLLRYTGLGRNIRAVADDIPLALISGVPVERVVMSVWALSGVLGGIAGIVLAYAESSFTVSSDETFFVIIIAAAFVGGIGKPFGAAVGALVIGLAEAISSALLAPALSEAIALAILVVVLVVRPSGLLGRSRQVMRA